MSTRREIEPIARWLTRPLCGRYVSGVFRSMRVNLKESGGTASVAVHWGIGHLLDGEREILGMWQAPNRCSGLGLQVVENLRRRGVLRIRTLAGQCAMSLTGARGELGTIGCEHVLPLDGVALSESAELQTLHPSVSQLVLAGDRLADEIQARLSATARRQQFPDHGAAMRFIATELYREDRRLWAQPTRTKPRLVNAGVIGPAVCH